MKKPAIPTINVADQRVASLLRPMKEHLEILSGTRGGTISQLPASATLDDIISKVNTIIARLNA